jgi:hypothetical protein
LLDIVAGNIDGVIGVQSWEEYGDGQNSGVSPSGVSRQVVLGVSEYSLILSILNDTYSHLMAMNILRYQKEYIKTLSLFQPAFELGKSLCITNLSYSMALRVLKQVGFSFDHNIYYNIRSRVISTKQNEFTSLVIALEEAGFLFKYHIKEEIDPDTNAIIRRQL